MESHLRLLQNLPARVFPDTKQKERQGRPQSPELGFARNFGFRLPSEELCRHKKCQHSPKSQREDLNQELPNVKRLVEGELKGGNEIGGRQEKPEVLDGVGQIRKRESGAGEKNQGQPDDLIEDLRFLHGVR